jgi:hypothetical protein
MLALGRAAQYDVEVSRCNLLLSATLPPLLSSVRCESFAGLWIASRTEKLKTVGGKSMSRVQIERCSRLVSNIGYLFAGVEVIVLSVGLEGYAAIEQAVGRVNPSPPVLTTARGYDQSTIFCSTSSVE